MAGHCFAAEKPACQAGGRGFKPVSRAQGVLCLCCEQPICSTDMILFGISDQILGLECASRVGAAA